MKLFYQHVVRYVTRHKLLALINVVSIALGISVFLSIEIINRSATRSFAAGVDLVAGRADLEARGAMDDALWPKLKRIPGCSAATPLVEGLVTLPQFPGEYLHVLGIDPLTNQEFQTLRVRQGPDRAFDADHWFADSHAVAVTELFAQKHRLKQGDRLEVRVGEKNVSLNLAFLLNAGDADSHFAAMDIGWAQELFGMPGKLSAVLFRVDDPTDPQPEIDKIRSIVPADVVVEPPKQRSTQVAKMLAGFQLNLTALSLVSLLVGIFLIYNTITASVVRRRNEIGILRSLGASRTRVRWLFLGEACLYGICGSVAGCIGAIFLSNYLVGIVSETVTNLYVLTSIERFYLPMWEVPGVVGLGILTTLTGAWIPASQGAKLTPLRALNLGTLIESSQRPGSIWLLCSALSLIAASLSGVWALAGNHFAGFFSAFFTLTGFCLLAPLLVRWLGFFATRLFARIWILRLAAQNLVRSAYRNAVTVAALASAIGMLISVSIMIFSFRTTINRWVDRRLAADVYISPTANEIVGFQEFIATGLIDFVRSQPEVDFVDSYRDIEITIRGEQASLGVVSGMERTRPKFVGGNSTLKFKEFVQADTAIASEPLARRFNLKEGDLLTLAAPAGERSFRLVGIFYDYTRDSGLLLIQRANFEKYWKDSRVNSLALYLRPGSPVDQIIQRIQREYPGAEAYTIRSNQNLRKLVAQIFDQTFTVTYLLRFMAVGVAVIGTMLNLTVLAKEREREIGMLRALGLSGRQIALLILGESVLIAGIAVLLGLAAGGALAYVLTEVINKAFFGWTVPLIFPFAELATNAMLLLPVALLGGLLPAIRACRTPIIETIRVDG
ncbi:MAG: FtsX-like permease family protein [Chthoniobacterales bacterium]